MGPKLRNRLPEATEAIQHNDIHKPQGKLLGHTGGKHLGTNNERVHHQRYRTRTQAIKKIIRRIEIFLTGKGNRPVLASRYPPLLSQRYYENQLTT